MAKGIVIPADDTQDIRLAEFRDLSDYQTAVGGMVDWIDLVTPPLTLFTNLEGKLRGLPINRRATSMWWAHKEIAYGQDIVVGDAVLTGPADTEGFCTSIPEDLWDLLRQTTFLIEINKPGDPNWYTNGQTFPDYFAAALAAADLRGEWPELNALRVTGTCHFDGVRLGPA